jgi:phage FluMu protein Com
MPCHKCGHLLILYDNEEICPKCKELAVLDSETAVKVGTRVFNEELRKWERDTLLGHIAAKRELMSREYFNEHSLLNVGRLAALTLLIRRVTEFSNFIGKIPRQPGEIDELVEIFESVKEFESVLLKLRSGYNNILYLNKFNEISFTLEEAKRTFLVVANETYLNL